MPALAASTFLLRLLSLLTQSLLSLSCSCDLPGNGGPGASSAFGLFTELGPLQITGASLATNPPTLYKNPYAWTRLANVLILNGPAPVGYSFCTPAGPAGDGESCGSWNDTRTAIFNFNFINGFFAAFPEFAAAPFYIAGESYAGVYVGQLTQMLLDAKTPLNLKGIALGDVCMGTDVLCGQASNEWSGPWFGAQFRSVREARAAAAHLSHFLLCARRSLPAPPPFFNFCSALVATSPPRHPLSLPRRGRPALLGGPGLHLAAHLPRAHHALPARAARARAHVERAAGVPGGGRGRTLRVPEQRHVRLQLPRPVPHDRL